MGAAGMHTYFDKGKELSAFLDWMGLLLPMAIKVYDTYSAFDLCVSQLNTIKLINFFERRPDFPDLDSDVISDKNAVEAEALART